MSTASIALVISLVFGASFVTVFRRHSKNNTVN